MTCHFLVPVPARGSSGYRQAAWAADLDPVAVDAAGAGAGPSPLTVWSAVPSTTLIRGSPFVWLSAAPRRAVRTRRAPARWPGGNSMRLCVMSWLAS